MSLFRCFLPLAAGALFCLLPVAAVAQTGYTIQGLSGFGTNSSHQVTSSGRAINSKGLVVGYSYVYDAQHNYKGQTAFLSRNGAMLNLGNFGTDSNFNYYSIANAVNTQSQVVGYSNVYDAQHNALGQAAFLWQNGAMTNLGNLGTDSSGNGDSVAIAINASSQVAGFSTLYDGNHNNLGRRAFLWQNNVLSQLPVLNTNLSNVCQAYTQAINDKGQVVGSCNRYDSNGNLVEPDAVLWPNATTIINLNNYLPPNSGWVLRDAIGINNRGQITGDGIHNGAAEAFLLTPYVAGDFNNDASPDILLRNAQTGDLVLGVMNATSLMGSQPILSAVPSVWKVAATPDLNGDGYADILWQNSQTGDIAFWLLNSGRYQSYGYLYRGLPLNWKVVASADFNADGYTDLVLQDTQTGNIAVWYLTNAVYYTYGLVNTSPGANWQVAGTGDFNGDGQTDLLLRSKSNGDLYVWLLNGLNVTKGVFVGNVPLSWSLVGVGDFGGDGNTSLLWQNSNNDLYYWLLNGTTVASYGLIQNGVPGWQVVGPK